MKTVRPVTEHGPEQVLEGLSGRPRRAAAAVLAATSCVAVLLAGCATVPGSGPVTRVVGGNGQAQAFVQPLPPARPQRGWTPHDVVDGFLAASAVFANNYQAARQYLTGTLRQNWTPTTVTIVGTIQSSAQQPVTHAQSAAGRAGLADNVNITGQRLATLTPSGQYTYQTGSRTYVFQLVQISGRWLISQMSVEGQPANNLLLLTENAFEQVYQPRNLYYLTPGQTTLVPDPVFAPLQGTNYALNTDLATRLVTALLKSPSGWLNGATSTAFPPRPKPSVRVGFSGSTAIVSLDGMPRVSRQTLSLIAAQLVWTLTSDSYRAAPVAHSVQIRLNGKTQPVEDQQTLQAQLPGIAPSTASANTVYLVDDSGGVSAYAPGQKVTEQLVSSAQVGHAQIRNVAASAEGELALTAASSRGCTVYYGNPGSTFTPVQFARRGPTCSSVSWDGWGNLWVAAGSQVWNLALSDPTDVGPFPVTMPPLPGYAQDLNYPVDAIRVSPDGVRVAMLVKTPGGQTQLIAAAIHDNHGVFQLGTAISVGASVANPTAVSWYDPDHLVVLGRKSQLYAVPLNGGAAQPIGLVPAGTQMISAARRMMAVSSNSPDASACGSSGGCVMMVGQSGLWHFVAKGSQPAFPG
jgi:Lipoprotein LpqB beta-propeller domain/Sporulation and spore germination